MLFSCKDSYKPVGDEAQKVEFPQGIAGNFKLIYTVTKDPLKTGVEANTHVEAILTSSSCEDFDNSLFPRKIFPEGLQVDFFNSDGKKSVITADHGIIYSATNLIDLQGNVVVRTDDGKILKTPQLYMDSKSEWIFTQEKFEFTNPEDETIMYGTGFDCNQKIEKINAHKTSGLVTLQENDKEATIEE